jgi:signal transduction histidine kinase/CheY-like chemotaxis protein
LGLSALILFLSRSNRSLNAALEAARVSRALSRALFVNNPDYLLVLDVEPGDRFVISDINPALEGVLKVDATAVRGRVLSDVLPPAEAGTILPNLRRVAASDVPVMIRSEFNLPGGPRTWESLLAPVKSAEGATERIIASIRDITERIKTEDRLRESQKMESIGQLTGGVAHDFNNLLQVIRGNLELLAPMTVDNPLLQRRVGAIMNAADRAAQLTRQLLAFARRQPLEPEVINLATLVGDMTELLRRTLGESIDIKTVIAADLWNTVADPAQVESAVLNLALNARDAMDGSGRLTVEISNADLDESYVRDADGLTPGEYVLIAVSDTGQGMTPEVRKRVFEPFFTTKTEGKGTGLGLSMVYGFVRQSRGHIRLYSEPGEGTTVKMYLPRATGSVRAPLEAHAGPPLSEGGDILVVEDDPAVRAVAVTTLGTLGYRCLEAQDAASALAMLEAGARVDLVFSDVIMPGPVTARAFAERLSELAPSAPVLFTSGYTQGAVIHQGRLDEGVHLLSKPYSRDDLARKIAELMSLARTAAGPDQSGAAPPSAHRAKA